MRRAVLVSIMLGYLPLATAANFFPVPEGRVAALYRSSRDFPEMRIHIATFDADEKFEYNWENCQVAAGLFQEQPGVKVRYWCEKGRYRK